MHIFLEKIIENDKEVTYKFFNESSKEDGIFILFKDKMDDNFKESCQLIKPIVTISDGQALYTRAIVAVYKSYKADGLFPQSTSFYGAG